MADLSDRLASGEIDLATWQIDMRKTIRDAYASQIWAATEGNPNMNDYLKMGSQIQAQDRYLADFAREIKAGDLSPQAISSRSKLYARSSGQVYWDQATGNVKLPAYPRGSNGAPCRVNCKCEWRDNNDGTWTWVLGPNENHCEVCSERAAQWNPYIPPQSQRNAA